jgi:hypothetical protein
MGRMPQLLAGERQPGESRKAILACNDFLRLESGRSLPMLAQRYAAFNDIQPPTRSLPTLKNWSATYGWQERAAAYDIAQDEKRTAETEARRRQALDTGLALDYERVLALKELAGLLLEEIQVESDVSETYVEEDDEGNPKLKTVTTTRRSNVWLGDVKQIGSGESAQKVNIVRFNNAIFEQFRGLLDDLAKETGGRVKRTDITSGGKPVIAVTWANTADAEPEEGSTDE